MTNGREVVILSGARTPIGKYGGALKDVRPTELGALAAREAIRRAVTLLDRLPRLPVALRQAKHGRHRTTVQLRDHLGLRVEPAIDAEALQILAAVVESRHLASHTNPP